MAVGVERAWTDGVGGRVVVTIAVLMVYRLGRTVPLPGIDHETISALFRQGWPGRGIERMSLFTLGLVPLLAIYILAETLRLVSPTMARWQAVPANDRRMQRWLRGVALLMAAVQGWAIALAMEGVDRAVIESGWSFRIGTVATLVAATAFLAWLADVSTRYGVVNGFWLIAAAPEISDIVPNAIETLSLYRIGVVGDGAALATAAYLALSAAALIRLHGARHASEPQALRVSVWPPLLASTAMTWITAALAVGGNPRDGWFGPGQAGSLTLFAVLILLFTLRDALTPAPGSRSDIGVGVTGAADTEPARVAPPAASEATSGHAGVRRTDVRLRLAVLVAAVQIAICVAGDILTRMVPLALPGMWLIVVVAVALGILDTVRGSAEARSETREA